jgi:hypothetical protein
MLWEYAKVVIPNEWGDIRLTLRQDVRATVRQRRGIQNLSALLIMYQHYVVHYFEAPPSFEKRQQNCDTGFDHVLRKCNSLYDLQTRSLSLRSPSFIRETKANFDTGVEEMQRK